MKKKLSIILSLSICGAIAQSNLDEQQHAAPQRALVENPNYVPIKKGTSAVASTGIGKASNAYSTTGVRTYLWVDPSINTIAFTHRNDVNSFPGTTSGHLRYDVSTDGGQTWAVDQGPVYSPTGSNGQLNAPARYPQGVIFNPLGNTVADSAYLAFFAPSLNGTNSTGSWGGQVVGSIQLDGTDLYSQEISTQPSAGLFWQVADDLTFVADSQKVFGVNGADDITSGSVVYNDTVILSVGTFNSTTKQVEFTHQKIQFNFAGDSAGTGNPLLADIKIAFSPDGSVGYISGLGYLNDPSVAPYGVYSPTFMKTTDGGKTWSTRAGVNVDNLTITGHGTLTFKDSLSSLYPSWTIGALTTAFEHDLVVDKNGNPHMILNLCPSANNTITSTSTSGTAFSVYSALNMIVDVYSTDGGTTWKGHFIDTVNTFRGDYGIDPANPDFTEDNRPQIARNADGSMLIYAYGTTGPLLNFGTTDNLYPDVWMRSLAVDADTMGTLRDMTGNTADIGSGVQLNLPHIVYDINSSGEIFVPVTATGLSGGDPTQTSNSVQYNFFDFMYKPAPDQTSIAEFNENESNIKSMYPNPATNSVAVMFTVKEAGKYDLKITNITGTTVRSIDLGNIGNGDYKELVDIANLTPGVYVVSLRSGKYSTAQRLIVH
jgi:hypothetical protein